MSTSRYPLGDLDRRSKPGGLENSRLPWCATTVWRSIKNLYKDQIRSLPYAFGSGWQQGVTELATTPGTMKLRVVLCHSELQGNDYLSPLQWLWGTPVLLRSWMNRVMKDGSFPSTQERLWQWFHKLYDSKWFLNGVNCNAQVLTPIVMIISTGS